MNSATAWILPLTSQCTVAVGEFELIHVLPEIPVFFPVPQAPGYCECVLIWQNKVIPVMDLVKRFDLPGDTNKTVIGIVVFWPENSTTVDYGALILNAVPSRYEVNDKQACPLLPTYQSWSGYTQACFQTDTGLTVPVLNLERLFA